MYESSSLPMQVTLSSAVSTYGKASMEQRRPSRAALIIRWLQLKKYQYEVTLPLYMLTPVERVVFNTILLVLASMLIIAMSFYLPDHVAVMYNRIRFYVEGSTVSTTIADAVKTTRAALTHQTTPVTLQQVAEHMTGEL